MADAEGAQIPLGAIHIAPPLIKLDAANLVTPHSTSSHNVRESQTSFTTPPLHEEHRN